MKNLLLTLLLLLPLHAEAQQMKAGPEYMPAEMEPITAPFDVCGISRPAFADRTATVKMNKRGLSTRHIQTVIDRMSRQGGGTVVIPDGQWTSGRIELKSGVCLHLSDGASLSFSGYIKDYQPAVQTRNEGYDVMSLGAMIYANGAENIGLTGRGHIVGPSTDCEIYQENRKYLVVEECVDITKPIAERLCDGQQGRPVLLPMTVAPVNCKNVLIEGITIDQGLFWNIVPQYCDNVIIRGVTVNSAGHGRTDGIDIESTTNSLIEYCQLDCGDDCYTIKSGRGIDGVKTARPSVGCIIRHSVALRGGGGLVLGSETAASMWNIYMHDCRFEGTEQGIRIKSRRPRGGGAHDVWVERVVAKDIKWNGLTVDMLGSKKWVGDLANRFPAREVNALTPEFKNIYIKDYTVDGCQRLIDVKALPERPLANVLIENFEGRGGEFLRLQDVSGLVMKNATVRTIGKDGTTQTTPSIVLDGCQSVMLLDMDFCDRKPKVSKKNATIYLTEKPAGHYLFAYFNNNTTEGQQVCYAVSDDGVNFTPLNGGRPVIASDTIALSGGVRDPHILRGQDGWFYQVLTDMDMSRGKWTCQGIVMLRSRDLISWEHHTVHFPERYSGTRFADVNAVWAPQTIFDPAAGKYMVYFSLHSEKNGPFPQDAVYYAYASSDFSTLEGDPQPLFTYPHPTIDTDIVQDVTGLYHLFFNTWGGPDGLQRRQYEARDLHDQQSWTLVPGHQQPTSLNSEGSTCYQLSDGTWMLSYDCFKDGVYQFCRTRDFRHYELVHETKTEGNFTPRHGGIIQITDAEYKRLINNYQQ